jgi:hypothetical protein
MRSYTTHPLVACFPDPELALRREILVTGLFKYVADIQDIEDGYAFKFRRSELLIRRIADYIVFEGQYSPQLMFVLVSEPNNGAVWLQVRGLETEKEHIRAAYATHHMHARAPSGLKNGN